MRRALALLALPCAAVTLWLYPRTVAGPGLHGADETALTVVRESLSRLGIDPNAYRYTVRRGFDEERFERTGSIAQATQLRVQASPTDGRGHFEFQVGGDGSLRSWRTRGHNLPGSVDDAAWVNVLGRDRAKCFERRGGNNQDERRWVCREDKSEIIVETDEGRTTEVRLIIDQPRNGSGPKLDWLRDSLNAMGILWIVCLAPACIVWTFSKRNRHRDHLKASVKLALVFTGIGLVLWAVGALPRMREEGSSQVAGLLMGRPLGVLFSLAPGFALVRGWQSQSWVGAFLASRFQLSARRLGREALWALMVGAVISFLVTVVALVAAGWVAVPALVGLDRLSDRFQFTSALAHLPLPLFAFGAMAPWLLKSGRMAWWKQILFGVGLAGLVIQGMHPVVGNGLVAALTAAAIARLLWWAYREIGLLAALGAMPAAVGVPAVALSLARQDWVGVASEAVPYTIVLGSAWWVSKYGQIVDETELAAELERRNTPPSMDDRPERERLLTEVALAREAQQALLPAHPPVVEGFTVHASCLPAGEVGGDLYDYLHFPGGRVAFCVADVSGKGVGASVYNTYAKGMLAALAHRDVPLTEFALELNGHFLATARRKTFVTLVVALLDPATRRLQILRLGHNPPLWWKAHNGETAWLSPAGLGVGLASNRSLQRVLTVETVTLDPGDVLILYSDGLTEAMNRDQQLFGEDRLQLMVKQNATSSATQLAQTMLNEVERFRDGAEPNDDLTLLVLRAETEQGASGQRMIM